MLRTISDWKVFDRETVAGVWAVGITDADVLACLVILNQQRAEA